MDYFLKRTGQRVGEVQLTGKMSAIRIRFWSLMPSGALNMVESARGMRTGMCPVSVYLYQQ